VYQPEVTLWRAVILQQFLDAVMHAPTRYKQHDQRMARQWLLNNSEGFRLVCEGAEVSPPQVLAMARGMAAAGWPHRKFNVTDNLANLNEGVFQ
jgi:hypothetical protein